MNTLTLKNVKDVIEGQVVIEEINRCYYSYDNNNQYKVVIGLRNSKAKFTEHYVNLDEAKRRYEFIISLIANEIPGIRAMTFPGVY
jgi:hypothetical protein